jgi:hypothetical protein
MNAARFRNALRIMLNIEPDQLWEAGIADDNWGSKGASHRDQMRDFVACPIREALRMPDANFEKLFALIESKQPEPDAYADMLAALQTARGSIVSGFHTVSAIAKIDAAIAKAGAAS